MKQIAAYLNSLPRTEQERFAEQCGTSVGYLRKAASVGVTLRERLCAKIERYSQGAITRRDLRPDDWQDIWPELVDTQHPAPSHPAGDAAGVQQGAGAQGGAA